MIPNPFWPIRVRCDPMLLLLAILAMWGLGVFLGWALIHVGARDDPPEWDEPEDGVQPGDLRTLWLSDNLTGVDGGLIVRSGRHDGDHLD